MARNDRLPEQRRVTVTCCGDQAALHDAALRERALRAITVAAAGRSDVRQLSDALVRWAVGCAKARQADGERALRTVHGERLVELAERDALAQAQLRAEQTSRIAELAREHAHVEARAKAATLALLVDGAVRRLHMAWRQWVAVVRELSAQALREQHADELRRELESGRAAAILALLTRASMRGKHMAWRTCGVHLLVGDDRDRYSERGDARLKFW